MSDPAAHPTLAGTISLPRLAPYVAAENGDLSRALRLYTWNVEVSAAFWGVLHAVEIGLRNAMHNQLVIKYAQPDWWNHPSITFTHVGASMLDDAKRNALKTANVKKRQVVPGDVVAASSYGFWSGLTGRGGAAQYETQFWQPALVKAFPHAKSKRRADTSRTLESVRLFRNRVAHHEPIFGRHLEADHVTLLEIASDVDYELSRYVSNQSRVLDVLARRGACVSTGQDTSF